MALAQLSVQEIVNRAVIHRWGIPEFQRGFVWTPQKVRDLAESLWADYPIGTFLLWRSGASAQARADYGARTPEAWVVDGQQRTTALCLVFGHRPYWWRDADEWNDSCARFDVRFNPLRFETPYFRLANAVMRRDPRSDWVPIRDLVNANDDQLGEIASAFVARNALGPEYFAQIWMRLDRVRNIRERMLITIEEEKDLEDMVEIFVRLNQAGTKATEADVFLALAASRNPGWVRDKFLPLARNLEEGGFELDSNLLFRTWIAIGTGKGKFKLPKRVRYIMRGVWNQTEEAWGGTVDTLREFGVLNSDILPTKNVLIPMAVMVHRFGNDFKAPPAFAWLLHTTAVGRYGRSATAALAEDIGIVTAGDDFHSVVRTLRARLEPWEPFTSDQILADYRDRFLRLVLYLLAYHMSAHDWGPEHHRLGFERSEPMDGFVPDWHHIFPRAYLREHGFSDKDFDALANIAVVHPGTHIRAGRSRSMSYLKRHNITDELLEQQLIPTDPSLFKAERYRDFLQRRAELLAHGANEFFAQLENG